MASNKGIDVQKFFFDVMFHWHEKQRIQLGIVLVLLEFIGYVGWVWFTRIFYADEPSVHYNYVILVSPLSFWLIVFCVVSFIISASISKHNQKALILFQVVFLTVYSLLLGGMAHLIGELSFMTGIAISCTPVLGLLIFNRYVAIYTFFLNVFVFLTILYLISNNVIQDGPLFPSNQFELSDFWIITYALFVAIKLSLVIFAMDMMLQSLRQNDERIEYLSEHDELTQLINRSTILNEIHEFFEDAQVRKVESSKIHVTAAILDIDDFKVINDTYGHTVGDTVLRTVAADLRKHVRETDLVGRYGGEEFLIFLKNCELEQGLTIMEALRQRISNLTVTDKSGNTISVTGSFGVVSNQCIKQHENIEPMTRELLECADNAMYRAKQAGKNRVEACVNNTPQNPETSFMASTV